MVVSKLFMGCYTKKKKTFATCKCLYTRASAVHAIYLSISYVSSHHWLELCAGHHGVGELHLLGQHGHVFLLDEVVPSIDLQLGL